MIFQLMKFLAVFVFLMLTALGIHFDAPLWFFFAAIPVSPVLAFGVFALTAYTDEALQNRARAKRRAAAAARRAKGEAL